MHHKSIYIASSEPRAGSLIITIGFMEILKGRFGRVAFFRPIIPDGEIIDNDIDFMLKHFELDISYEDCCGFTISDYTEAYGSNREEKLHEALIRKVNKLDKEYDFVVI